MEKARAEIIKATVEELLSQMDFGASVTVTEEVSAPDTFSCMAKVDQDQHLLIGQGGANLAALQHLARIIIRKKIGEPLNVTVDINEYFSAKKALLEQEAERAAQDVLRNNAAVTLRPMMPYERKVVHTFLAARENIATESIGTGDARKIIVRPQFAEGIPEPR